MVRSISEKKMGIFPPYRSLHHEAIVNKITHHYRLLNPMKYIFCGLGPKVVQKDKRIEYMIGYTFDSKLVTSWDERLSQIPERPEAFSIEHCRETEREFLSDHKKLEASLASYTKFYTMLATMS